MRWNRRWKRRKWGQRIPFKHCLLVILACVHAHTSSGYLVFLLHGIGMAGQELQIATGHGIFSFYKEALSRSFHSRGREIP